MTPSWLLPFLKYASLSTLVLRGSLVLMLRLDVMEEQRAAIFHELRVRAWADAVEATLSRTIAWCRGGRS